MMITRTKGRTTRPAEQADSQQPDQERADQVLAETEATLDDIDKVLDEVEPEMTLDEAQRQVNAFKGQYARGEIDYNEMWRLIYQWETDNPTFEFCCGTVSYK